MNTVKVAGFILMLFIVVAFCDIEDARALSCQKDTDLIVGNINEIASYVGSNGYVNADGNKVVTYQPRDEITSYIVDKRDQLLFGCKIETTEYISSIEMSVLSSYSDCCSIKARVLFDMPNAYAGTAIVDPDKYIYESNQLQFQKETGNLDTSVVSDLCNTSFDLSMAVWDEMLGKQLGMGIAQLGFPGLCNHVWGNGLVLYPATYVETGKTRYICKNCGFITCMNTPKLAKKANPMAVKPVTKTVKVKKLKKKALKVAPLKVTNAKGTVTYKITGGKAKSKKALKINAKTGKITVKKKTKKGTYKVKVTVKAAGTIEFKPGSKRVNVTIKAK